MLFALIVYVNSSRSAIIGTKEEIDEWFKDHDVSWYDSVTINKLVPEQVYTLKPLNTQALDTQLFRQFGLNYSTDWKWVNKNLLRHDKYGFIAQIPVG
jgi:hypothetical protein